MTLMLMPVPTPFTGKFSSLSGRWLMSFASLLAIASLTVEARPARAQETAGARSAPPAAPLAMRVVELFTSHGCSSCPQADALLGELLADDPDLVALEFHVDYWNSLVHGSDGSFTDPFSNTVWSLRQRAYDGRQLAGRAGVYTPQMIIDGGYAAVGSDRRRIGKALKATPPVTPAIRIERQGDMLQVHVADVRVGERTSRTGGDLPAPVPDTGEVALVRFLRETITPITGGENKGLEIVNHRVVTSVEPLGRVSASGDLAARVSAPAGDNEGCAILVRHGDEVAVLAGRVCPDPA